MVIYNEISCFAYFGEVSLITRDSILIFFKVEDMSSEMKMD